MGQFKRKRKLINRGLQLRLVAVFALLGCMAALFQVLLLNRSLLSLAREAGQEDLLLRELPGLLSTNLGLTLLVLVPTMIVVGVLVTHRVAGPAYRMEQHLKAIAKGEQPGVCRIRKGDELQSLCDALNAAVAQLGREKETRSESDDDRVDSARAA